MLLFVGYQVYSGATINKIGIPGIFMIELESKSGNSHKSNSFAKWVDSTNSDSLPQGALQVNQGGLNIWVCRAWYKEGYHPGKLFRHPKRQYICNIGWGGQEIVFEQYQVLTGVPNPNWQNFSNQRTLPDDAFLSNNIGDLYLYVCRAKRNGRWHSGKLFYHPKRQYICNIGWGGQEIVFTDNYQVLTSKLQGRLQSRR